MLLCYSSERKGREKKLYFYQLKKKNDALSKNNERRAATIPVLSQMSHPMHLVEPGSHLVRALKSHVVQGI